MSKDLFRKLFGDKGYLSKAIVEKLYERGLALITSLRKNMKARVMPLADRLLLHKRLIIGTIND